MQNNGQMRPVRSTDGVTSAPHNVKQQNTRKRSVRNKLRLTAAGIVALILLGAGGWFGGRMLTYQAIDTTRYQAVYLDNDNVYFGKVKYMMNGDMLLTDVFRIQAGDAKSDDSTGAANDIRLIKPGSELHAPDDTMRINRSKVVFVENLKTDGKVTQAILDYKKQ